MHHGIQEKNERFEGKIFPAGIVTDIRKSRFFSLSVICDGGTTFRNESE